MVYGGFRLAYPDKIVDAGPLQISVTRHESFPVSPVVGAGAIIAGVALILLGKKK